MLHAQSRHLRLTQTDQLAAACRNGRHETAAHCAHSLGIPHWHRSATWNGRKSSVICLTHLHFAQVYNAAAKPVEDFFREHGTLLDFDIYGGIPETMPRLLHAVGPFHTAVSRSSQQRATVS